ncbi:MAG: hypothetical protein ABW098_02585 [Candidatus Thiodiazotropha sp.]
MILFREEKTYVPCKFTISSLSKPLLPVLSMFVLSACQEVELCERTHLDWEYGEIYRCAGIFSDPSGIHKYSISAFDSAYTLTISCTNHDPWGISLGGTLYDAEGNELGFNAAGTSIDLHQDDINELLIFDVSPTAEAIYPNASQNEPGAESPYSCYFIKYYPE